MHDVHCAYCAKMSRAVQLKNFIILSITLITSDIAAGDRNILPTNVEVREGEDLQVRLLIALKNEISCYVKTPYNIKCNLTFADGENNTNCDERIHYWSFNGTCGFYITNVQEQDHGLWRLTAEDDKGNKIIDVVEVQVLEKFNTSIERVEIPNGLAHMLSFPDVDRYCIVQHPYDPEEIIMDNECNVELKPVTRVDHGNWIAIVGVKGQIDETVKKKEVSVFQEHLDSGYITSSNPKALHLFCNLKSENRNLNMCRFTKVDVNQIGLRVYEGLRKGRYGYYGNGLAEGDCGLTIQSPEETDYGRWYCLLIAQHRSPLGTTIQVLKSTDETLNVPPPFLWSNSPVVTTEGEIFQLQCSSGIPLSYCRFVQPDGEIVKSEAVSPYIAIYRRNYQTALTFGDCAITIQAEGKHNGTWTCYMGPASLGIELSLQIAVRVAETYLAAVDRFVFIKDGTVTLQCKTVSRVMPLTYCRFYSPSGLAINIDEHITRDNPIQRGDTRYWYSGRNIVFGDCGLVIGNATPADDGNWTCAAKLELPKSDGEISDIIHFVYQDQNELYLNEGTGVVSTGAITGIALAVIATLIALAFLIVVVKKRYHNRSQDGGN